MYQQGRPVRKTYPANLLIAGRRAVVVGGGRVGLRKIQLLLESDATVVLVCPTCVPELETFVATRRITHVARCFEPEDVKGAFIVFACTDNKHVNREVLDAARTAHALCGCADGNWPNGDFTTPATARNGDVVLTVSTGGASCRHARIIKDVLKQQLDRMGAPELLVIGTGHDVLNADARALFHLDADSMKRTGDMVRHIWGVHEFLILNTCNRTEIVAIVARPSRCEDVLLRITRLDQLGEANRYVKHGRDAYVHLARVVAGMNAQMLGETHITAQFKDALGMAMEHGWCGGTLAGVCETIIRTARDIRHAVEPLMAVSEIESVAVAYARAMRGITPTTRVAVVGSGAVGKGVVAELILSGCMVDWVYHATPPSMPASGRVTGYAWNALTDVLVRADIVISAVNVVEPVITVSLSQALLIDLGMPRNISSTLGAADLDTLKNWSRATTGARDTIEDALRTVVDSIEGDGL